MLLAALAWAEDPEGEPTPVPTACTLPPVSVDVLAGSVAEATGAFAGLDRG
jgi:hypothetical protein